MQTAVKRIRATIGANTVPLFTTIAVLADFKSSNKYQNVPEDDPVIESVLLLPALPALDPALDSTLDPALDSALDPGVCDLTQTQQQIPDDEIPNDVEGSVILIAFVKDAVCVHPL